MLPALETVMEELCRFDNPVVETHIYCSPVLAARGEEKENV
jgi:hypothetical protein